MELNVETGEEFRQALCEETGYVMPKKKYSIAVEAPEFCMKANKKEVSEDEVEYVFSWPTEKKVYDYASWTDELVSQDNLETEVYYFDEDGIYKGTCALEELKYGWNKILLGEDKEIEVLEATNALTDRGGQGIGWGINLQDEYLDDNYQTLNIHEEAENYDNLRDWIKKDREDVEDSVKQRIIDVIEEELELHSF